MVIRIYINVIRKYYVYTYFTWKLKSKFFSQIRRDKTKIIITWFSSYKKTLETMRRYKNLSTSQHFLTFFEFWNKFQRFLDILQHFNILKHFSHFLPFWQVFDFCTIFGFFGLFQHLCRPLHHFRLFRDFLKSCWLFFLNCQSDDLLWLHIT